MFTKHDQSPLEKAIHQSMFCKICLAKINPCLLNVNQSLINIDCCFVKDRIRYRVKAACIIINVLPCHVLRVISTFVSQYEKRLQFGRGAQQRTSTHNCTYTVHAFKLQPFLILTDKSPHTGCGMACINDDICGFHPVPYAILYETAIDV